MQNPLLRWISAFIFALLILLPQTVRAEKFDTLTIMPIVDISYNQHYQGTKKFEMLCQRVRDILVQSSKILKAEAGLALTVNPQCLAFAVPSDIRNRLTQIIEIGGVEWRDKYGGIIIHELQKRFEFLPQDRIAFFAPWLASSNGNMPGRFFTVRLTDDDGPILTVLHELGHTFGCGHDKGDGIMGRMENTSYTPECKK
ncbi:MAG: hypothetical protein Q7R73_01145 [bacterium]|nr:hypothetical protein [bacterium]